MRCAQSLQRSRLFAALGHNEDFVATIERTPFPIADGDVFLLCTDGFWEYIDENAMVAALAHARTPADWLRVMERDVVRARGQRTGQFLGAGGLVQRAHQCCDELTHRMVAAVLRNRVRLDCSDRQGNGPGIESGNRV